MKKALVSLLVLGQVGAHAQRVREYRADIGVGPDCPKQVLVGDLGSALMVSVDGSETIFRPGDAGVRKTESFFSFGVGELNTMYVPLIGEHSLGESASIKSSRGLERCVLKSRSKDLIDDGPGVDVYTRMRVAAKDDISFSHSLPASYGKLVKSLSMERTTWKQAWNGSLLLSSKLQSAQELTGKQFKGYKFIKKDLVKKYLGDQGNKSYLVSSNEGINLSLLAALPLADQFVAATLYEVNKSGLASKRHAESIVRSFARRRVLGAEKTLAMKDVYFRSLLRSKKRSLQMAKDLVAEGSILVNSASRRGVTPIMIASGSGDLDRVDLLSTAGADLNARAKDGRNALMFALRRRHIDLAKELVKRGVSGKTKDRSGQTALMLIVRSGDVEFAKKLVAAGADVNARDKFKQSVVDAAIRAGSRELVTFLMDKIDYKKAGNLIARLTTLQEWSLARKAIRLGADANLPILVKGKKVYPLHVAARSGRSGLVNYLISKGKANMGLIDGHGRNVLEVAEKYGNTEVIRVLKSSGILQISAVAQWYAGRPAGSLVRRIR